MSWADGKIESALIHQDIKVSTSILRILGHFIPAAAATIISILHEIIRHVPVLNGAGYCVQMKVSAVSFDSLADQ